MSESPEEKEKRLLAQAAIIRSLLPFLPIPAVEDQEIQSSSVLWWSPRTRTTDVPNTAIGWTPEAMAADGQVTASFWTGRVNINISIKTSGRTIRFFSKTRSIAALRILLRIVPSEGPRLDIEFSGKELLDGKEIQTPFEPRLGWNFLIGVRF